MTTSYAQSTDYHNTNNNNNTLNRYTLSSFDLVIWVFEFDMNKQIMNKIVE